MGTTLPTSHCQNCGSPLYGEHCYACGQPTKGLVRHFGSIAGDAIDTLFNVDGRLLRTLPALLLKPGFLSREYFEGHRVRYVSPVRLFVFLCIATFFAAKLASPSFDLGESRATAEEPPTAGAPAKDGPSIHVGADASEDFRDMATAEAVEARRAEVRKGIAEAKADAAAVPGMGAVLAAAQAEVDRAADARLAELAAAGSGAAAAPPPASTPSAGPGLSISDDGDTPTINLNGRPWHPRDNPVAIDALPAAANDWLNAQIGHVPQNWQRIREEPDLLRNAFYSALPSLLFVLVPVFALVLKGLYLFKGRLYMEHLVVALHGHAFVCAVLLVLMALTSIERLLGAPAWLSAPLGWLEWAAMLWVPVYLWLHLKRVYGQGVLMTTLKFSALGLAELVLLSIVATGALLSALVWL